MTLIFSVQLIETIAIIVHHLKKLKIEPHWVSILDWRNLNSFSQNCSV